MFIKFIVQYFKLRGLSVGSLVLRLFNPLIYHAREKYIIYLLFLEGGCNYISAHSLGLISYIMSTMVLSCVERSTLVLI